MKTYHVRVNGKDYTVEIEQLQGGSAPAAAPQYAASAPVAAPSAPPAPAGQPGEGTITSPMPGTVLQVPVQAGDAVKAGDILIVLEAMKMENEILAPRDGVVSQVAVSVGASVDTGDVLVVL